MIKKSLQHIHTSRYRNIANIYTLVLGLIGLFSISNELKGATRTCALELGADVNAVNETGSTALHGAAFIKSDALVRLLVDSGAALNPVNTRGQTPLMVAELSRAGSAITAARSSTGDLLRELGAETVERGGTR